MRAFSLDVAVGEELMRLLVVVLLAFDLHKLAAIVELAEEVGSQLMVGLGGGAGIDIEGDAKVLERLFDDVVVAIYHVLRGATLLLGPDGHRHSMLVAAADEEHILTLEAKIAHVDVGWHIDTCQVSDVHRTVGVGQCTGH